MNTFSSTRWWVCPRANMLAGKKRRFSKSWSWTTMVHENGMSKKEDRGKEARRCLPIWASVLFSHSLLIYHHSSSRLVCGDLFFLRFQSCVFSHEAIGIKLWWPHVITCLRVADWLRQIESGCMDKGPNLQRCHYTEANVVSLTDLSTYALRCNLTFKWRGCDIGT